MLEATQWLDLFGMIRYGVVFSYKNGRDNGNLGLIPDFLRRKSVEEQLTDSKTVIISSER